MNRNNVEELARQIASNTFSDGTMRTMLYERIVDAFYPTPARAPLSGAEFLREIHAAAPDAFSDLDDRCRFCGETGSSPEHENVCPSAPTSVAKNG